MPDRLQEEPDPTTRVQLYGFPIQLEALKSRLYTISSTRYFEPTRYHANATSVAFISLREHSRERQSTN